mmetsp:Transcript_11741/g.36468  ORF Transcript_11741/g.36468 Transcript_11741/m.36468 type:complete len:232 (-) Transcript_11741:1500-2195(-)
MLFFNNSVSVSSSTSHRSRYPTLLRSASRRPALSCWISRSRRLILVRAHGRDMSDWCCSISASFDFRSLSMLLSRSCACASMAVFDSFSRSQMRARARLSRCIVLVAAASWPSSAASRFRSAVVRSKRRRSASNSSWSVENESALICNSHASVWARSSNWRCSSMTLCASASSSSYAPFSLWKFASCRTAFARMRSSSGASARSSRARRHSSSSRKSVRDIAVGCAAAAGT